MYKLCVYVNLSKFKESDHISTISTDTHLYLKDKRPICTSIVFLVIEFDQGKMNNVSVRDNTCPVEP